MLILQDYVLDKDVSPNHRGFDFRLLATSDTTVRFPLHVMWFGSRRCLLNIAVL